MDAEMQALRKTLVAEHLNRAADEYRASRQARDDAKAVLDAAEKRVDELFEALYREITGNDLAERFNRRKAR